MKIEKRFRPGIVCCKEHDHQPELCNPILDKKNRVLFSTDGHCMVAIPVEVDPTDPAIISKEALEFGRKGTRKRDLGEIHIKHGRTVSPSGHRFPIDTFFNREPPTTKLKQAFKESVRKIGAEGTISVGVNVDLLRKVATALGTSRVVLTVSDGLSAITVRPLDPQTRRVETGLVMPVRMGVTGKGVEEDCE